MIARFCEDHVLFMALYGDQAAHFDTIAAFVSTLGTEVAHLFGRSSPSAIASACRRRETFAVHDVTPPNHASNDRSVSRADVLREGQVRTAG
ncbi:MAG: hypothetical protein MUF00_18290 [Gemmatimonadaceae bacterium]|jgi:hypothetical protein|nr:hypothetical protein [Gemmatimonadaceae bacterium]